MNWSRARGIGAQPQPIRSCAVVRLVRTGDDAPMSPLRVSLASLIVLLSALGCAEEKKKEGPKPLAATAKPAEPEAPPTPKVQGPLRVTIDDQGPTIDYNRVSLVAADGRVTPLGLEQLKKEIDAHESEVQGKAIQVETARNAKPVVVAHTLSLLFSKSPERVTVQTETRSDFAKELTFTRANKSLAACSVTGAITKERASAIWKVQGGTARKQVKGMSGPDLTMAQSTIDIVAKGCKSDVFVVGAADGVDWGLTYDLAAAARAAEKAGIQRIALPVAPLTLGRPVELE